MSRPYVLLSLTFAAFLAPSMASANSSCQFNRAVIEYEYGSYFPADEYYCQTIRGSVGQVVRERFRDTRSSHGVRFDDAGAARQWLKKNAELLAVLRGASASQPTLPSPEQPQGSSGGVSAPRASSTMLKGTEVEILSLSALQVGLFSLDLWPPGRAAKRVWRLFNAAPDVRPALPARPVPLRSGEHD